MIDPGEFGQWYYLLYLLPGGLALLLLTLSAFSGGSRHHRGSAGHRGASGHHGAGRHGGGGHRGGKAPQASKGHRSNSPESGQSIFQLVLAAFGFGRVPGPFIWGSFLLGWGLCGFWATRYLEPRLSSTAHFVWPALAIAMAGGLAANKLITSVAARVLPQDESYAVSAVDLCGQTGTAAFEVNDIRGRVHVYDEHGTMHINTARTASGQMPIARGRQIIVVDYDAAHDQLIVEEIA